MKRLSFLPALGLAALTGVALQAQDAPRPPATTATAATAAPARALAPVSPKLAALKTAVAADVKSQAMFDLGQQMVDMVFSFSELGFQEFETQKYLTAILEKEGFTVEGAPGQDPKATPSPVARQSAASRAPLARSAAGRSSARRPTEPIAPVMPAGPVSGVQQLLALAQQGGAR